MKKIFDKDGNELGVSDIMKDPLDICAISEVYDCMIDYRNENSENQQRQLAVSCKVIKTILLNAIKK